jgi:hypothetical protein
MQDDDEAAFLAGADATPAPETPAAEPEKATDAATEPEESPEAPLRRKRRKRPLTTPTSPNRHPGSRSASTS